MKTILTILFFIPLSSFGQTFASDTTLFLDHDAGGNVMKVEGKISGNVIIRNAIIEANPYIQIFDTSVTLIGCKTREFSTAWYGAKSSNIDNSSELQKSIDVCIANRLTNLFIADSYSYNQSLTAFNLYNGNYVGFALNIYGEGDMWSDKTILTYTGNYFAFGVQHAKGGSIKKLKILGNYIAPSYNGPSYYSASFPVKGGHSGIVIDYDGYKNTGGSTGYTIEDTWVDGFDVLYNISPSAQTFNADMIRLNHIRCGNGRIGVQSNQAQEKGNEINYIASWGNLHTLIQIGNSGKFQAGQWVIRGGNIAGYPVQLFDISLSGWNAFAVDGLTAESLGRIGTINAWTYSHTIPVDLSKLYIRFASKSQAGNQTLFQANSPRIKISNSTLWYYGQSETMDFVGSFTFENCDFGLSTWANPNVLHISYNNSSLNLSHKN